MTGVNRINEIDH